MQFKQVVYDQMLDRDEEDIDVFVRDDVALQQFFLRENIAKVIVLAAPLVERIGDTIPPASHQRPWRRGGVRFGGGHRCENGRLGILPMRVEMAEHGGRAECRPGEDIYSKVSPKHAESGRENFF